jgi:hypothetical protein
MENGGSHFSGTNTKAENGRTHFRATNMTAENGRTHSRATNKTTINDVRNTLIPHHLRAYMPTRTHTPPTHTKLFTGI